MRPIPSANARESDMDALITPRPCVAMRFTSAAVMPAASMKKMPRPAPARAASSSRIVSSRVIRRAGPRSAQPLLFCQECSSGSTFSAKSFMLFCAFSPDMPP